MNKILSKQQFSEKVFCLTVEAPLIARSCRPGQFIIVRVDKNSERVPYTIAKSDTEKGTLTLVVQEVGLHRRNSAAWMRAIMCSTSSDHLAIRHQ